MKKTLLKVTAIGGPFDGLHEVEIANNGHGVSSGFASAAYSMTNWGEVGKRFWSASNYALDLMKTGIPIKSDNLGTAHKYEVIESETSGNEISLVVKYIPEQDDAS